MTHHSSSTAKDFFLHLLSIAMLYFGVVTFILLLFQYVNLLFPDVLTTYRTGILDSIRWSTASLIVVYPVYALTVWLIHRDLRSDPSKADVWIRRWLTYLTLFLAAIAIVADLVTLIYNFLNGELTVSFTLKIVIVLLVVLGVFGYYFWDLKRRSFEHTTVSRAFGWGSEIIVVLSIVGGFFLVGSPFHQRQVRLDERRVSDLQILQSEIINFWTQKGKIPSALENLRNDISGFAPPVDPVTGSPYEYARKGTLTFELCAVFAAESIIDQGEKYPVPRFAGDVYQQNWSHGAGRTCFERTIDPEIYRPVEKPRS